MRIVEIFIVVLLIGFVFYPEQVGKSVREYYDRFMVGWEQKP